MIADDFLAEPVGTRDIVADPCRDARRLRRRRCLVQFRQLGAASKQMLVLLRQTAWPGDPP